jgi:asparagine synthase (glutamine-hydrolysing)
MIVKVDRTSMLASLECRAPFWIKRYGISQVNYQIFFNKRWDKNTFWKNHLKNTSQRFLNKSKKGFGVPVGNWLRAGLKRNCYLILIKRLLKSKIYFILKQFLL